MTSRNNPFIFIPSRTADGSSPLDRESRREGDFYGTHGFYWRNSLRERSPSNIDAREIRLPWILPEDVRLRLRLSFGSLITMTTALELAIWDWFEVF